MSIAALSMARTTAMMYNSTFNAFSTMDSKRAMANSGGANMDAIHSKEKDCDSALLQDRLQYQIADVMQDNSKKQVDDWAKTFNVFA